MKIVTWNVNGIRARATAFEHWIQAHQPGVLCLQEIKAHPDQIPGGVRDIRGYTSRWHGARGGYSGVSIHVSESLGEAEYSVPHFDEETRVLQVRVGGLTVVNVYTPLGQRSYSQKIDFLGSLVHYITHAQARDFQPANITFDLLLPLEEEVRKQIRDKRERHRLQCERALQLFDAWWQQPVALSPA